MRGLLLDLPLHQLSDAYSEVSSPLTQAQAPTHGLLFFLRQRVWMWKSTWRNATLGCSGTVDLRRCAFTDVRECIGSEDFFRGRITRRFQGAVADADRTLGHPVQPSPYKTSLGEARGGGNVGRSRLEVVTGHQTSLDSNASALLGLIPCALHHTPIAQG